MRKVSGKSEDSLRKVSGKSEESLGKVSGKSRGSFKKVAFFGNTKEDYTSDARSNNAMAQCYVGFAAVPGLTTGSALDLKSTKVGPCICRKHNGRAATNFQ